MKFKRLLSALAAAAVSVSAFAGITVSAAIELPSGLKTIDTTSTIMFADYITETKKGGGLTADDYVYVYEDITYSNGKGSSTVNGTSYLNCCRVKNVQDQLFFKVSDDCTIMFYTQSHASRGLVVTTNELDSAYDTQAAALEGTTTLGAQTVSTTTFEVDVANVADAGQTLYVSSYGGDFYIAGFTVTYATTDPTISVAPTTYDLSTGDTMTLTATTQNADGIEVEWSSSDNNTATVAVDESDSTSATVTGVEAGEATIKAKITVDSKEYTATCAVTVADEKDVTLNIGNAVKKITLTNTDTKATIEHSPERYKKTIEDVPYGTYDVEYEYTALYAYNEPTTKTEQITVDSSTTPTITCSTSTKTEFPSTDYSLLYGNTVVWQFTADTPTSINYLAAQGNSIVAAGAIDENEDQAVYIYADATSGKFNSYDRISNGKGQDVQVNNGTILQIPVVADSEITLARNSGGTFTINGTTYSDATWSYTATDDDVAAGYVEITVATSGYIKSITVTSPEKATAAIKSSSQGLAVNNVNGVTFSEFDTINVAEGTTGNAPTASELEDKTIVTVVYKATEAPTSITVDGTEVTSTQDYGFNDKYGVGIIQFYGGNVSADSDIVLTFLSGDVTATTAN